MAKLASECKCGKTKLSITAGYPGGWVSIGCPCCGDTVTVTT